MQTISESVMILTIDTQKDTAEDIKKIISLLQQYTNQSTQPSQLSTTPQTGSFFDMPLTQTQQQPTQVTPSTFFDTPAQTPQSNNFFATQNFNQEQPKIIFNLDDELTPQKKAEEQKSQKFVLEPY